MSMEIRILTGARAGQVERFNKPVVLIGRHSDSDLRFDPNGDLDVSGRHAEIHAVEGRFVIRDTGSTNGTFVNGARVTGEMELNDGDRILFGAKGPETEFQSQSMQRSTEQRIALAVSQQTAGLRRYMIAAIVLVAVGAGTAYFMGQRKADQRVDELRQLLEENDKRVATLQGGIGQSGDTALMNELDRRSRSLRQQLTAATSDAERDSLRTAIAANQQMLSQMIRMDLPAINLRNAPAIALIVSEIGGRAFAGTGFGITPDGLLLTNRHNVVNESGQPATRMAVKFRDTGEWLEANVVKVAAQDNGDLALVRIVAPQAPIPVVQGIQATDDNAEEGAPVAIIGFPLGYNTAMEGEGENFVAKTTLNSGTVSKRTSTILQIDSFAAHGSSGSPVFNARGHVVGVVFGGPGEGTGRIVYAVPADKIASFVSPEYGSVIR